MKLLPLRILGLLALLAGCSSPKPEDYSSNTPKLDIRQYLNGHVEAWGMFISPSGKADPMFHVDLQGTWNGNDGTLKEHFVYNTGKIQDRQWNIHFSDDHHFTATAADVVGVAQGAQYGNATEIQYVLTLTTDSGSTHNLTSDDWLYQMDNHTLLNHNVLTKLGFKVGELVITFHK